MKVFLKVVILVLLISCNSNNQYKNEILYKGDLFFKLISFGSNFNFKDKNGKTLYENLNSISDLDKLTENEKEIKKYFDVLKKNELLGKPYFKILFNGENEKYITVFLNEKEYKKIKNYNFRELQRNNQKVEIEFYGKPIELGFIKCSKIKSTMVVQGITNWEK